MRSVDGNIADVYRQKKQQCCTAYVLPSHLENYLYTHNILGRRVWGAWKRVLSSN